MGEQVAAGLIWGRSSVGRAPALQAGGQEFESLRLHSGMEMSAEGPKVRQGPDMYLEKSIQRKTRHQITEKCA